MMQLSIVIPAYNVEKYLEQCIKSCLSQNINKQEYEIIIINDGSKDGTLNLIKKLNDEHSNISYYSQENSGLSATRNKGITVAKGKYIWFVDSDDWIETNSLKDILVLCEVNNLDVIGFSAANIIKNKSLKRFSFSNREGYISTGRDFLKMKLHAVCAPFSIFKKEFLINNKLCFVEGIFHEDAEFTPRAYYKANTVMYVDKVMYYVRQTPNSITRSTNPKKSYDYLTVAASLDLFVKDVDVKYKVLFYDLISLYINNSLANIKQMSTKELYSFNKKLFENSYLINNMLKSSHLKYRIEGILFKLFNNKYVQVYQIVQKLNMK